MSDSAVRAGRGLSPLADAMASVLEKARTRRVTLDVLVQAAIAIDRSGPGRPDWRARLAAAMDELVAARLADQPRTMARWDRRTLPALPLWLSRPTEAAPPTGTPARAWHYQLHWVPAVDAERRLSRAELHFLTAVNGWLPHARQSMVVPMRERSWQLVGNDKALEAMRSGRLFEPGRLSLEILRCRPTWPPVQQQVFGGGRWLVVENWSTFESLCSVAALASFDGRIMFGAGTQVGTRVMALADAGVAPDKPVLYFGDLDAGGLRAARLAASVAQSAGWPAVVPCRELYELTLASEHRLTQPPVSAELAGWAKQWFGGHLGERVRTALVSGLIVRQEAVGLEQLSGRSFWALLDDRPGPAADTRNAG